ncbi:MAG: adenylyltransferase/cytidyltransferase family protein [Rhodospirillales bacterium]|nr:adenylyltransferase/cytidyltransferase family protein [Rhodospirillales bacterium]
MSKTNDKKNQARSMASVRDLIKTVPELADISEKAKAEGKAVVLAHGVFDLLHLGHVRHLEKARELGDVLMVTVTADQFVNKGPGRPVFPEELRAEMLAALEYVDWAGVNFEATAENLLEAIKPSVYVKGSDYGDAGDDPTGKIVNEQEIVEKHGGRLAFTDDLTFSSSQLINEHLLSRPPAVQNFLGQLRDGNRLEGLIRLIDRAAKTKALFVGETILDEYLYVSPLGKTAKDSIIATQFHERELFAGGVIAAANHAASFCAEVEIVTVLGGNDDYEDFVRSLLAPNVTLSSVRLDGRPTIRKRRYVDSGSRYLGLLRKLFEVSHIDDTPISDSEIRAINNEIRSRVGKADVVVVCDFGHGMIEKPMIETLMDKSKFLAVNAQANSANMGFNLITKYPKADYICIDEREARLAVCDKHMNIDDILKQLLIPRLNCDRFFVTRGSVGSSCWGRETGTKFVPALEYGPVDTMGSGDAFLAITAVLLALGGDVEDVGFIGNVVGGIKAKQIGHRTLIEKGDVKKAIIGLLK